MFKLMVVVTTEVINLFWTCAQDERGCRFLILFRNTYFIIIENTLWERAGARARGVRRGPREGREGGGGSSPYVRLKSLRARARPRTTPGARSPGNATMLRCVVQSARDLPGKRIDPVAKLQFLEEKKKTKVIKNKVNPVWDELITFELKDILEPTAELHIDVKDDETIGRDK
uniref:C2 domain-containing protein n=1 Tax=Eptatretus burgeri TaxID=7764 RepID=A0A8C4R6I6_EPTBU